MADIMSFARAAVRQAAGRTSLGLMGKGEFMLHSLAKKKS